MYGSPTHGGRTAQGVQAVCKPDVYVDGEGTSANRFQGFFTDGNRMLFSERQNPSSSRTRSCHSVGWFSSASPASEMLLWTNAPLLRSSAVVRSVKKVSLQLEIRRACSLTSWYVFPPGERDMRSGTPGRPAPAQGLFTRPLIQDVEHSRDPLRGCCMPSRPGRRRLRQASPSPARPCVMIRLTSWRCVRIARSAPSASPRAIASTIAR